MFLYEKMKENVKFTYKAISLFLDYASAAAFTLFCVIAY